MSTQLPDDICDDVGLPHGTTLEQVRHAEGSYYAELERAGDRFGSGPGQYDVPSITHSFTEPQDCILRQEFRLIAADWVARRHAADDGHNPNYQAAMQAAAIVCYLAEAAVDEGWDVEADDWARLLVNALPKVDEEDLAWIFYCVADISGCDVHRIAKALPDPYKNAA